MSFRKYISLSLFALSSSCIATFTASAAQQYPPKIADAKEITYKKADSAELKIWVFQPTDIQNDPQPAMIFFFGGGWKGGSPKQFVPQAKHLAQRGMVGIVADYRVLSRHGVRANSCVEDARDALRYVTEHAHELNIDPNRIGVGGGSAGGHLAACLGTLYSHDKDGPAAMALYNPATVLAPLNLKSRDFEQANETIALANRALEARQAELSQRLGVPTRELSPYHHVSKQSPPTIIFHGTKDTTVPYLSAVLFTQKLKAHDVNVALKTYPNAGHSFFNREPQLSKTTQELDQFLVSLGWLK